MEKFVARIAGVNLPTNKRVIVALTYIHGIGPTTARKIADKLGIDHSRRVQDLSDAEVLQIRETIDADHHRIGNTICHAHHSASAGGSARTSAAASPTSTPASTTR